MQCERHGAFVNDEKGLPVRERSYRKWVRQIARAADIPDELWNMDSQAGAITEALEAGVDKSAVQPVATHSNPEMTDRYDRETKAAVARRGQGQETIPDKEREHDPNGL